MLENTNHYPEENNPFDVSGIQRALRHLLEDFSDEVPSEMIFGQTLNKEGRDYKVRKNWFATIANLFYLLRIEANMEEDLEKEIIVWINHFTSKDFQQQELVKKVDIENTNRLLAKILAARIQQKQS